jgi:pimeloyl-ACP methyl ester carboxylesterase
VNRQRIAMAAVVTAVTLPVVGYRLLTRRGGRRLLAAPRTMPGEAELGPQIDAMGGEVLRLRSRDGLRLSGRWLPSIPPKGRRTKSKWVPDPHEAIVLLHGWSGSVAPDIVEYAPFLRQTAGVLALDFRGHGESDGAPTTWGMNEVEDVAGALAWLGERGVERAALFGTSMGGMTAIASVGVLGDGTLAAADMDLDAPAGFVPAPRPRIVAVIADSVPPELAVGVGSRLPGPLGRTVANRLFAAAARDLGRDPRETEPVRMVALVEPVPLLLIHGEADRTVPLDEGKRLAAAAGPAAEHWTVPGADHAAAHATMPQEYEARVTETLRSAFVGARERAL